MGDDDESAKPKGRLMRTWKKAVLIAVLGFLELVFLSWVFASNLPRRAAEIEAFTRYENAPTEENEKLWTKERETSEKEVRLRMISGVCLSIGNAFLLRWVIRKGARSSAKTGMLRSEAPSDST